MALTWPGRSGEQRFLAGVTSVALILVVLLTYRDTIHSMVDIWLSSGTFTHCLLVSPIALWLAWRRRAELAQVALRPFWPALLLVAATGVAWLIGRLASANVVEHFALVLMIQSIVIAALGWRFARAIAFPLIFLLFAVPFGEAFVPRMIDWTADFTVAALKLTGVPVFREGNDFAIPNGHWSVAKACSGIRYLLASTMAGALYAYVMYKSTLRRAVFFSVSIIVPLIANWLRAYLIVLLGYLSDNRLAAGVDHLIYGWFFFGIVLLAMFWIGQRYREDGGERSGSDAPAASQTVQPGGVTLAATALLTLAVSVPWAWLGASFSTPPEDFARTAPTIEGIGGWAPVADTVDWQPHFSGQRATTRQVFEKGGKRVGVHIAYYAGQSQDNKLIRSANTLVMPGETIWHEIAPGLTSLAGAGLPRTANRATVSGGSHRFDVLWWYWVDDHLTSSDSSAKLMLALTRLRLRGDDSAAVFLYADSADSVDTGADVARFATEMGGSIIKALDAVRDQHAGQPARVPSQ